MMLNIIKAGFLSVFFSNVSRQLDSILTFNLCFSFRVINKAIVILL